MKLEAAGRPTVVIATDRFAKLAIRTASGYGLESARIVVVPHPIGGAPDDALRELAARAIDGVVATFSGVDGRPQGGR